MPPVAADGVLLRIFPAHAGVLGVAGGHQQGATRGAIKRFPFQQGQRDRAPVIQRLLYVHLHALTQIHRLTIRMADQDLAARGPQLQPALIFRRQPPDQLARVRGKLRLRRRDHGGRQIGLRADQIERDAAAEGRSQIQPQLPHRQHAPGMALLRDQINLMRRRQRHRNQLPARHHIAATEQQRGDRDVGHDGRMLAHIEEVRNAARLGPLLLVRIGVKIEGVPVLKPAHNRQEERAFPGVRVGRWMVVFADHERLARHALKRQAGHRRALRVIHHGKIVHHPIIAIPLLAGKMRMLPVGVAVHQVHVRLQIRRGVAHDGANHGRFDANLVQQTMPHRLPIVPLRLPQKPDPIPMPFR